MFSFATGLTTRRAGSASNQAIERAMPSAKVTFGWNSGTSRRTFALSKTLLWALSPRRLAPRSGTSAAMRALGTWTSRASAPAARAIVS